MFSSYWQSIIYCKFWSDFKIYKGLIKDYTHLHDKNQLRKTRNNIGKLFDENSVQWSSINLKEMITYFKDGNQKSKKSSRRIKSYVVF